MNWQAEINGFTTYLQLEKGVANNTIIAYKKDILNFADFVCEVFYCSPTNVTQQQFESYLAELTEMGIAEASQARFISSMRHFYKYLMLENLLDISPIEHVEMPKLAKKLPDTLSHNEIQAMIASVDVSKKQGHRNRAILEVLYASGLRVSELINLKLSNIFREEEFLRVIGKGNKERFVPIHQKALREIELYEEQMRNHINIKPEFEDHLFLSVRGNGLSRIMVYNVVKKAAEQAGIVKNISPHTLRHSFATELVTNGANLRAVQDMLGHASIVTTEIYTHLDRSHLRKTIEEFHPLYVGDRNTEDDN